MKYGFWKARQFGTEFVSAETFWWFLYQKKKLVKHTFSGNLLQLCKKGTFCALSLEFTLELHFVIGVTDNTSHIYVRDEISKFLRFFKRFACHTYN